MNGVRTYASRLVLPVLLLVAGITVWMVSSRLGSVEPASAAAATQGSLDAPLVSVRRLPEYIAETSQADAVALTLAQLPPEPAGLACVSILVDGQVVSSLRGDLPLVPSYAQIFITGHAAIDILGPDYRFETQVFADALPDLNGRIFNGAYLIGGGDPGLMTLLYARGFRPTLTTRTAVEDLAQLVADAGVVRIDGGVIAVERRFDTERSVPGWPDAYLDQGVIGPLSALQLDDGFLERASANGGVGLPSEEPATLAAERFVSQLEAAEIQVFGENRTLAVDEELPELVPVARVFSPPLAEIVLQTLAVNDATAAELLLKELGVVTSDDGTTQAGTQAVQRVLQDQGIDVAVPFRDGSGLDPFGGTTCDQLVDAAETIPADHPTLDVLPSYRLPGVFDGRLVDIDLQADLRLVGGSHDEASGFVGRTLDSGPRVTIASIINRPGGATDADLAYQLALVGLVDELQAAVNVDAIALGD